MTNDFEVRAEMILPKSDIARTTRRQKIAGKYSARFPDALERQIASNVPFSLQNAASEKKTNGPQVKRVSMLDCGRLSPCISKLVATTATVPKQRKKANRIALARNKHGLKLGTTRELDCIESIILREIYLMAIQKTSTKLDCLFYEINELPVEDSHCAVFRAELWESLDAYINELVLLLNYIRIVSLDVVQKAVNWHPARHSSIELNYHGGSYIAKMASDLTFLSESPGVQNFTACQFSEANPFLLPIGDPATEEACLKASDQVQLELKRASLIKEGLERNILCIPY